MSSGDDSGISVSSAGDFNGDGLADLFIGAYHADPNGFRSGSSYVVFGSDSTTPIELSDVANGAGGFVVNGESSYDCSGYSVGNAGDINGDGLNDLIIGALAMLINLVIGAATRMSSLEQQTAAPSNFPISHLVAAALSSMVKLMVNGTVKRVKVRGCTTTPLACQLSR